MERDWFGRDISRRLGSGHRLRLEQLTEFDAMGLPYENGYEFIRAKAEVQDRFTQATAGRYVGRTNIQILEACRRKLSDLADLHLYCLRASGIPESDQHSYLRDAIQRECLMLFAYASHSYAELELHRDSLLRAMVGEKEERPAQANPSDSSSPKHRDAATVSAKPVGANARYPNKGDLRLLHNLNAVNLHVACEYLGIGRRGLQKAVKAGKLDVIGEGQNRKITVASLRRYLPPSDFAN